MFDIFESSGIQSTGLTPTLSTLSNGLQRRGQRGDDTTQIRNLCNSLRNSQFHLLFRSPHAFQAFGQGPRACLGMRFALLELKVAVAMLVRHLELLPGSTTIKPLQLDPEHGMAWFKGGLWASVKRRDVVM